MLSAIEWNAQPALGYKKTDAACNGVEHPIR
jgi:hypothetical protein